MTGNAGRPNPAPEPEQGRPAEAANAEAVDNEQRITELTEAVQARDEFISIAAHELRNPMTPILFEVERLRDMAGRMPDAGGLAAGLERLERLVTAYLRRATTLLDVSRITSGRLHLELREIDLSGLIREVTAELAPAARRAGSPLVLSIQDGIVAILDRLGAQQIADNLLSNAIKYGAGRPIEIALASDGEAALLRVRDHGIGIAAEAQARIFGRFERVVMQKQEAGFGIGLWLVGRLVEAMGGDVSVRSRSGEGSIFTVRLPLRPEGEKG